MVEMIDLEHVLGEQPAVSQQQVVDGLLQHPGKETKDSQISARACRAQIDSNPICTLGFGLHADLGMTGRRTPPGPEVE